MPSPCLTILGMLHKEISCSPADELLTTADVARIAGVVPGTIRLWQRVGRVSEAFRTPGGVRLYRRGDVERVVRARQAARSGGETAAVALATVSPWMNAREAAAYIHRCRRYLAREVRAGRLRATTCGGKRELIFTREWLDAFLEDLTHPVEVNFGRRRA